MRSWVLIGDESPSDDTAYMLGHLTAVFDRVEISRCGRFDHRPPIPADGADLIVQLMPTRSRSFFEQLDAVAAELQIPLSNPAKAAWRALDKRCYVADYPDIIPRTLVARDMAELRAAREALGGDVVVKDPLGAGADGVDRVCRDADLAYAERLLAASPTGDLVVQEFCTGFTRGDKRIMVQRSPDGGREIVGQFRRVPPEGGWKSNLSGGGRMERCDLTDDEIRLAYQAAEIAALDYVGLDVGEHDGRYLLIETNHRYGGLIDYDLDRNARAIGKVGRFLAHLASHGRATGPGSARLE
jgi:glutathione synthase/RimK-type ligase-like ATP-grasp enzyme